MSIPICAIEPWRRPECDISLDPPTGLRKDQGRLTKLAKQSISRHLLTYSKSVLGGITWGRRACLVSGDACSPFTLVLFVILENP